MKVDAAGREESGVMKHILSVFVENQTGVLVRVASMFSRREFNIDSLSVGVTESPEFSLIFEITGGDDKVTAFLKVLRPYGIVEIIRTGLIALERGEHTIYEHCEEREYYGKNLL